MTATQSPSPRITPPEPRRRLWFVLVTAMGVSAAALTLYVPGDRRLLLLSAAGGILKGVLSPERADRHPYRHLLSVMCLCSFSLVAARVAAGRGEAPWLPLMQHLLVALFCASVAFAMSSGRRNRPRAV